MDYLIRNFKTRISRDESVRELYREDATVIETRKSCLPDLVIFPESTGEVSRILRYCFRNDISVYFRGGGSGLTGGARVTRKNSIVLSSEKLDKILKFDPGNLSVKVQPGLIPDDLNDFLKARDFYYPPSPASSGFSTLGGNIAENSNGLNVYKYGSTGDWVRGLTLVTGTGKVINAGREVHKTVAGFDLTSLITGSEGTLGFISEINLEFIKKPDKEQGYLILFKDIETGLALVRAVLNSDLKPAIFEFIDKGSLSCITRAGTFDLPGGIKSAVILRFEGDPGIVRAEIKSMDKLLTRLSYEQCHKATDSGQFDKLMELRRSISPALFKIARGKINEDLVIPFSKLSEFYFFLSKLEKKYRLIIPAFGHIGVGNIHTNIMYDPNRGKIKQVLEKAVSELFEFVIESGGSISGEHGIGLTKKKFLNKELGRESIKLQKKIKEIFDPGNIINPGKVF